MLPIMRNICTGRVLRGSAKAAQGRRAALPPRAMPPPARLRGKGGGGRAIASLLTLAQLRAGTDTGPPPKSLPLVVALMIAGALLRGRGSIALAPIECGPTAPFSSI